MLRVGDLTHEHAAQCAFSTAVSDTGSIAVMNEQNLTRCKVILCSRRGECPSHRDSPKWVLKKLTGSINKPTRINCFPCQSFLMVRMFVCKIDRDASMKETMPAYSRMVTEISNELLGTA
ncbi:Histidine--tRNA ligase [Frankliniella fusca]|uniref:Histidine--tRNA ligase n=1 Tax=Frankliniella fusca TaxID=407009 RepID=A0AAE1HLQ1_9NEOP|nr:Histidine--tRNA ligase [Frankliniella fusca]